MADNKTNLRELSVAVIFGLINREISFSPEQLRNPKIFWEYAEQLISSDISSAKNILKLKSFDGEYSAILNNGYRLANAIITNKYFKFNQHEKILWNGYDTQKEVPYDITIGKYKFSLKEKSNILTNMGLYELLNCLTGSNYSNGVHIFKKYAPHEYNEWFQKTWELMIQYLKLYQNKWSITWNKGQKKSSIILLPDKVILSFNNNTINLPILCNLAHYEKFTPIEIKEEVFAKFINKNLRYDNEYKAVKRVCAITATSAIASDISNHLHNTNGIAKFLRIYDECYYYAKTTPQKIEIYKVPSIKTFSNNIVIESITSSVPDTQANLLTTIRNSKTNKQLIIRNECRFSHGQFNGVPEAKMYYENNGSLLTIYEEIN